MNVSRMQSLTKDLIAIDSVTGREAEITDYLVNYLNEIGMKTNEFVVDGNRRNILACHNEIYRLLFNTHIDTVPQQYGPHEDSQRIYGRGACDTHGILAAQLEAMADLREEGVSDIGLLLVVGEETFHDGATHAGKSEIVPPDFLIVGEPTENKLMTAQKGSLKADLTVYGNEGHSGYPEYFNSAIERLVDLLQRFWQCDWLSADSRNGTTANVTFRENSHFDNQIPGKAAVRLMFRCAQPCAEVKQLFLAFLSQAAEQMNLKNAELFNLQWLMGQGEPIELNTVPDFELGMAAYNTDIHYFNWTQTKIFLMGSGSVLNAHRDLRNANWLEGEWLSKEEQIRSVHLYKKLARGLLGGGA